MDFLNMEEKPKKGIIAIVILLVILFILIGFICLYEETEISLTIKKENKTWAQKEIISVENYSGIKDKEISHFLYCLSSSNNIENAEWIKSEDSNIEITNSGKWYVAFKIVDVKGNESNASNIVEVYVDKDMPIVNNIKQDIYNDSIAFVRP